MNEATKTACACNPCVGASCNCGCRRAAAQNACACGTQCRCGSACACGKPKA